MYLLLLDPSERDRQSTLRMLAERGHVVTSVADALQARRALHQASFDAVIVDAALTGGALAFVAKLRTEPRTAAIYAIVTATKRAAGDMTAAFQAGADDFLQKPFGRDDLLGRVDGIARLKRWTALGAGITRAHDEGAADVGEGSGVHEVALSPACRGLGRLAAWRTLDHTAAINLGRMFSLSFVDLGGSAAHAPSLPDEGFVSAVTLSLPQEQLEVQIRVDCDAAGGRALTRHALGDEGARDGGDGAVRDMIGEVANTLAGLFSRGAATEGLNFTATLPSPPRTSGSLSALGGADHDPAPPLVRSFAVGVSGMALHVRCTARVRPNVRVRAGELQEGMILTNDLTNRSGALLVRAGTRLTSSTVNRVQRVLASSEVVEVAA